MFEEFLPLQHCAAVAHEANRMMCVQLGDEVPPAWADLDDMLKSSIIDGVKSIRDGYITTPEEVHASWMKRRLEDGWLYGPLKDSHQRLHPNLVPFSQLPEAQKIKDRMFFNIVQQFFASHPELSDEAP